MTPFPPIVLEAFRVKKEVEVETRSARGTAHRVTIWIVVVDDVPYVRSVRGERGRWFRELLARGEGVIRIGSRRIGVSARRVADEGVIAWVSAALEEKYDKPRASVVAMVREAVVASTARLDPA